MLYRIAALIVLFTALNTAYAQEADSGLTCAGTPVAEGMTVECTCEVSSRTLTTNTQIFCDKDLTIAAGTVVDTHGHFFQIVSEGAAELGAGAGLTIDSKGTAGIISIYVRNSMSGQLNIRNASAGDGLGGEIEITVGAFTEDYQQDIDAGLAGYLTVIAGGNELPLEGDKNTIARN